MATIVQIIQNLKLLPDCSEKQRFLLRCAANQRPPLSLFAATLNTCTAASRRISTFGLDSVHREKLKISGPPLRRFFFPGHLTYIVVLCL